MSGRIWLSDWPKSASTGGSVLAPLCRVHEALTPSAAHQTTWWRRRSACNDPIIKGLLARLPKSGEVWPEAERKLWLELLSGSFKLIYKDKEPAGRDGLEDVLR